MSLQECLQGFDYHTPDLKLIALTLIMLGSGFVSGMTGFGFSFIGAAALFFFEPKELIPLFLVLSTVTQLTSIWALRDAMIPLRMWWSDGPLPFILGGICGIPIGLWLLYTLNAESLCELVGVTIVAYTAWSLLAQPKPIQWVLTHKARWLSGFFGGVIGGFTAAPGTAVVIWGTLGGISKEKQRAIVQPFIVCIQLITIYEQLNKPGAISDPLIIYAIILCVFIIPANKLGVMVFRRLTDLTFRRVVLRLLASMGIALVKKGLHVWGELFMSLHLEHILYKVQKIEKLIVTTGGIQ